MAGLTAFILAGGRSSRMGEEKALLPLDGVTLVERALGLARTVTEDVRIAGSGARFASYGPVVEDVYPGCGPLAGIHAALRASATDLNLVLAVDMPLVEPGFLKFLAAEGAASAAVVTVPRVGGRWQPLCGVYRRAFADAAEAALRAGRYKIDALFAEVTVRALSESDLGEFAFAAAMFENLNTREDWQRAATRLRHHP